MAAPSTPPCPPGHGAPDCVSTPHPGTGVVAAGLRAVRSWGPLNRAASTVLRRFVRRDRLRDALVMHLPRTGEVTIPVPGGEPVRMWSGDDWVTSRLWWLGTDGYEPASVRPFARFAAGARTVLDVGAYTGYFSLVAASVNPAARVFAFEPNPDVAARLGRNLALNPDRRVTIVPYAVGAMRGAASFHLGAPGLPLSSSLDPRWQGLHETIEVAVVDLESFCAEWKLEHVDLVKLDVEHCEPLVVEGMGTLLAVARPVVFTEVLPGADDRYAAMSSRLAEHGYQFFRLTGAGAVAEETLVPPARWEGHTEGDLNHLACPAEKVPSWLHG